MYNFTINTNTLATNIYAQCAHASHSSAHTVSSNAMHVKLIVRANHAPSTAPPLSLSRDRYLSHLR